MTVISTHSATGNMPSSGNTDFATLDGVLDLARLPAGGMIRQTALRALLGISQPTEWRWRVLHGRLPNLKIQGWYDCAEVRAFLSGDSANGKRRSRRSRANLAA